MDLNCQVLLLLSTFLTLQLSAFTQPLNASEETEATLPLRITTNDQFELNSTKSLIPNTPGVQQFKNDLFAQLLPLVSGQEEDVNGVYEAEQKSSEIDLPCTTDRVTIQLISSNFPLPERFFHAPKRCSEEET